MLVPSVQRLPAPAAPPRYRNFVPRSSARREQQRRGHLACGEWRKEELRDNCRHERPGRCLCCSDGFRPGYLHARGFCRRYNPARQRGPGVYFRLWFCMCFSCSCRHPFIPMFWSCQGFSVSGCVIICGCFS